MNEKNDTWPKQLCGHTWCDRPEHQPDVEETHDMADPPVLPSPEETR